MPSMPIEIQKQGFRTKRRHRLFFFPSWSYCYDSSIWWTQNSSFPLWFSISSDIWLHLKKICWLLTRIPCAHRSRIKQRKKTRNKQSYNVMFYIHTRFHREKMVTLFHKKTVPQSLDHYLKGVGINTSYTLYMRLYKMWLCSYHWRPS